MSSSDQSSTVSQQSSQNSNIKFYLSGGPSNGDPSQSLGGVMSQSEAALLNLLTGSVGNVWDYVPLLEAQTGLDAEYRCIYIRNETSTIMKNAKFWFEALNRDIDITNQIGVDPAGVNGVAQIIANELTAPANVSFSQPQSKSNGLLLATKLKPGDYVAVWLKRSVAVNSHLEYNDSYVIRIEGDEPLPSLQLKDFGFGSAGNFSCESHATLSNITNIIKRRFSNSPPQLEYFFALGELALDINTDCWFDLIDEIIDRTHSILGSLEVTLGNIVMNAYINRHGRGHTLYYSFDHNNVHFLILSTEIAYANPSPQYTFTLNDLSTIKQNNPHIDWIVVMYHQPAYTANTGIPDTNNFDHNTWRDTYHPLFDQYGVDLVIQGHSHSYQRTFPITWNSAAPTSPTIVSNQVNSYDNINGRIFLVVGTGGHDLDTDDKMLNPIPSYYAYTDNKDFGYVWITVTQSGSVMTGTFYNIQNNAIDTFTITKG